MDSQLISEIFSGRYCTRPDESVGTTFDDLFEASDAWRLLKGKIHDDREEFMAGAILRNNYVDHWSWAYRPNLEGFQRLQSFIDGDKTLEINCGRALWAELYRRLTGHTWICTDIQEPPKSFCPVEVLSDLEAIEKYNDANVLVSIWPRGYIHDKHFSGSKLIYVGEEFDGCTGVPSFFTQNSDGKDIIDQSEWKLVDTIEHNIWRGMHDKCYLFQR